MPREPQFNDDKALEQVGPYEPGIPLHVQRYWHAVEFMKTHSWAIATISALAIDTTFLASRIPITEVYESTLNTAHAFFNGIGEAFKHHW